MPVIALKMGAEAKQAAQLNGNGKFNQRFQRNVKHLSITEAVRGNKKEALLYSGPRYERDMSQQMQTVFARYKCRGEASSATFLKMF